MDIKFKENEYYSLGFECLIASALFHYFDKIIGYDELMSFILRRMTFEINESVYFETPELIYDYGIESIRGLFQVKDKKIIFTCNELRVNTYFIELILIGKFKDAVIDKYRKDLYLFNQIYKFCIVDSIVDESKLYYLQVCKISYDIDVNGKDVQLITPIGGTDRALLMNYKLSQVNNNIIETLHENTVRFDYFDDLYRMNANVIYDERLKVLLLSNYFKKEMLSRFFYQIDNIPMVDLYIDFTYFSVSNFTKSSRVQHDIMKKEIEDVVNNLDINFIRKNLNVYLICKSYDYSEYQDLINAFERHCNKVNICINTVRVF